MGISPSAVTMWGDDVPELRQYQIERLTRGKVKRAAPVETTPVTTTAAVS
ncbi:hypothetical protein EQ828_18380 [Ectopseudomonas mendocina]|nr:hypothetical protein EQ828_18380 [Pseudomonas mendocina]